MRSAGILVATALSLTALPGHARAGASRAWAAAKARLPADTTLVFGLDLAAIRKTQLFAAYYPKLRAKPEVAQVLDAVNDACKLDPVAVVRTVVVGLSSDQQDGAAYIALSGIDRAKLSSCLVLAAQAKERAAKISIKQAGNITELSKDGDTARFGWVGKDVIVVPLQAQDKPALVKWMGGKGALASSALGKALAKVTTSAAIWGAGEGQKELEPGVTLQGGYGAVSFSDGNLAIDVHGVVENASQAAAAARTMRGQLDAFRAGAQGPSPELGELVEAVTVAARGDEVVVKASFTERDLLDTVMPMVGVLGGL